MSLLSAFLWASGYPTAYPVGPCRSPILQGWRICCSLRSWSTGQNEHLCVIDRDSQKVPGWEAYSQVGNRLRPCLVWCSAAHWVLSCHTLLELESSTYPIWVLASRFPKPVPGCLLLKQGHQGSPPKSHSSPSCLL